MLAPALLRPPATQICRNSAEPVAPLYEQGRLHHVGAFPTLEDQLAYISAATEREEFAQSVGLLSDFWIANEPSRVFPNIAGRAGREGPKGSFLLS